MKVFRFMSNYEFEKYRKGSRLINTTRHNGQTNSVGFCFLSLDEHSPEKAMHFLSGIATFEICAVFETDVEMECTYGIYAKPLKVSNDMRENLMNLLLTWEDSFRTNEYCTKEYSNKDFKLIKFSRNIWQQWNPLENQQELKWEECINELQTTKGTEEKNGARNKAVCSK